MKNLFEPETAMEMTTRLERLTPDRQPQWGKMNVAQALAHLAATMEMALGDRRPPRALLGRLIGPLIKRKVLASPMRRNSPTSPELRIANSREFELERLRLRGLIDRFVAAGQKGCTDHPHPFFGPMTPDEWALQMYKHLDHHFRQFGV